MWRRIRSTCHDGYSCMRSPRDARQDSTRRAGPTASRAPLAGANVDSNQDRMLRLRRVSVRNAEIERRPLADLGTGPDASAMALHDARCNREADPRALVLVGVVKPLKRREQLVGLLYVEAGSIIAHAIDSFAG